MDRPDALRQHRETYTVAWRRFLLAFSKTPNDLYCFFEGDDAKYYGTRIESSLRGVKWHNLNVGGKVGVLRIVSLLQAGSRYRDAFVAVFVDRDFDDKHPDFDRLYVTPCYSVENLYCTPRAIERIFRSEFGLGLLDDGKSELDSVRDYYEAMLDLFIDVIQDLNVWLYIQRVEERAGNGTCLSVKDFGIDRIASVVTAGVKKRYSLDSISEFFPQAKAVSEKDLRDSSEVFKDVDKRVAFRGKWLSEFMRVLVSKLAEDRNSPKPTVFRAHGCVRLRISRANLLSELAQYADTPDCLVSYLRALPAKAGRLPVMEESDA